MDNEDAPIPAAWRNWSGRLSTSDATVRQIRSEADAAAVAAETSSRGTTLRVAGAGHSHMPLVPTDDTIVDLSGLTGLISVDAERSQATIRAGTPVYALGPALHAHGLALTNQGDIDRQFIGGAVATGTHGTGVGLQNFSASVVGARLALASGELVDCSPDEEPDLWQAVRLNLGALGIVTRLTLQLRPAYRLKEEGFTASYAELAPRLDELVGASRHFEFFWFPVADRAAAKAIDETQEEPVYPLGDEGSRIGWNYEVLPNHRTWPHTEIEYSVPAEHGPACLDAIRTMLKADFPDMAWPVEYRSLAADDVWMSTAYERETVTISLHCDVGHDDEPLFRASEEIFRSFEGRPHWGKINYLDRDVLSTIHPRWSDWWRVRDEVDPNGTFLNSYLKSIRPRS